MKTLSRSGKPLSIPEVLRFIKAVAVAVMDKKGNIQDANKGFFELGHEIDPNERLNVADWFIKPDFSDLLNRAEKADNNPVYQGILNIGDEKTHCRSLNGALIQEGETFLIVAEHDIDSLENLAATVVSLNEELAQAQRDIAKSNRELKRQNIKIEHLMLTDPLTGVANRRHYQQRIDDEFKRAARFENPFCLCMCDIDHFKYVNDHYGHDKGDEVIKALTNCISSSIRETDFVARIGGEEFVILLVNSEIEESLFIIERLKTKFGELKYEGIDHPITASFGLSLHQPDDTPESMLKHADLALYESKEQGRNRVTVYSSNAI